MANEGEMPVNMRTLDGTLSGVFRFMLQETIYESKQRLIAEMRRLRIGVDLPDGVTMDSIAPENVVFINRAIRLENHHIVDDYYDTLWKTNEYTHYNPDLQQDHAFYVQGTNRLRNCHVLFRQANIQARVEDHTFYFNAWNSVDEVIFQMNTDLHDVTSISLKRNVNIDAINQLPVPALVQNLLVQQSADALDGRTSLGSILSDLIDSRSKCYDNAGRQIVFASNIRADIQNIENDYLRYKGRYENSYQAVARYLENSGEGEALAFGEAISIIRKEEKELLRNVRESTDLNNLTMERHHLNELKSLFKKAKSDIEYIEFNINAIQHFSPEELELNTPSDTPEELVMAFRENHEWRQ